MLICLHLCVCCVCSNLYLRSSSLSPTLFLVLSADTLQEIGSYLQNGKGVLPSDNNSGYSVLGPVTDLRGPVATDGTSIWAFELSRSRSADSKGDGEAKGKEDDIELTAYQFSRTSLKFMSMQELRGPVRSLAGTSAAPRSARSNRQGFGDAQVLMAGQNSCGELGIKSSVTAYVRRRHSLFADCCSVVAQFVRTVFV